MMKRILGKIGSIPARLRRLFYPTPHEKTYKAWRAQDGDRTLRLSYELDSRSVIFDVGGYEGQWASDIFTRYGCDIYIFEPVPDFAAQIKSRFADNSRIQVVAAAVGKTDGELTINLSDDTTSAFRQGGVQIVVPQVELTAFSTRTGLQEIDLLKLNVEGAEYEILEGLIERDALKRFRNIQIQFHRCVADVDARLARIHRELEKSHKLAWSFPFIWESWQRRD